jgi:D-aminopeptidase
VNRGRARARDLGIRIGRFPTGPFNAITDVGEIMVGLSTIISGQSERPGEGLARTGVTVIMPNSGNFFMERHLGGGFVLNGAGEVSGLTQLMEWGVVETPILLTNTMSVGTCSEAVVKYMLRRFPSIGREHDVIIPLVGECDDSWLNDVRGRHVQDRHVREAIESAVHGPIPEGNVGGGTGMITCDLKGGTGTASRVLSEQEGGFTVGVLVQSNFGKLEELRIDGAPVGRVLGRERGNLDRRPGIAGSIIGVAATDAPLLPHQLNRLAKRMALGVGRVGSHAAHGSGEIMLAFSTANKAPRHPRAHVYKIKVLEDVAMNPLYEAVIDATEEAILNAMFAAEEMVGIDGRKAQAIPIERVQELLERWRA